MRLTCPACGAAASAEAWANDAEVREAIRLIAALPPEVAGKALSYLALFRPSKSRGLGWARAKRLLTELTQHVSREHIQWGHHPARKNSAKFWAGGIQRVVDNPPRELPLKSHGYLIRVVYGIANEADREAEKARIEAERSGKFGEDATRRDPREPQGFMSLDEMLSIRRERFGHRMGKKPDA